MESKAKWNDKTNRWEYPYGSIEDDDGFDCSKGGTTALHLAAEHGHAEIVQLLLQRGHSVDRPNAVHRFIRTVFYVKNLSNLFSSCFLGWCTTYPLCRPQ